MEENYMKVALKMVFGKEKEQNMMRMETKDMKEVLKIVKQKGKE